MKYSSKNVLYLHTRTLKGKTLTEQDLRDHLLKLNGVTNLEVRKFSELFQAFMSIGEEKFNMDIRVDKDNKIQRINIQGVLASGQPTPTKWGRIVSFVIIGVIIFGIYKVWQANSEPKYEPYNSYTEDFNGDGIGGTEADHEATNTYTTGRINNKQELSNAEKNKLTNIWVFDKMVS